MMLKKGEKKNESVIEDNACWFWLVDCCTICLCVLWITQWSSDDWEQTTKPSKNYISIKHTTISTQKSLYSRIQNCPRCFFKIILPSHFCYFACDILKLWWFFGGRYCSTSLSPPFYVGRIVCFYLFICCCSVYLYFEIVVFVGRASAVRSLFSHESAGYNWTVQMCSSSFYMRYEGCSIATLLALPKLFRQHTQWVRQQQWKKHRKKTKKKTQKI